MARASFDLLKETRPFASPRANWLELIGLLSDCETVLDVGCGVFSPVRFVPRARLTGLDAFQPDLEKARALQTHDEFVLGTASDLRQKFPDQRFDACVAIDVIEHLTKDDGLAFLRDLEATASKRVVIFTPNGFLPQPSREPGDLQQHLSGWEAREMRELGYRVIGATGLKCLRGPYQQLRFHPSWFWAVVSSVSQSLWCRSHPESAAAIFCWKNLEEK